LNAVFLLGTWRYGQLRLGGGGTPLTSASFNDFFGKQAAEWKIPADDVQRVREVVDQAIERVAASAQGPVYIRIGSDTFDITSHSPTRAVCRIFPMRGRSGIFSKSKASSVA